MIRDTMLSRVFALCTDEEQAAFLNEAGRALRIACRTVTAGEEMQLFRIADHLDSDGKRFIQKLWENIQP